MANETVNQLAMPHDGNQRVRFCTSRDGVRLGFATSGIGPTVIAPAHWISHLRLDWDNPVRRGWLSMLSRRNTLVRYDARGTGLSDRNCLDFSLQRQIEDLEAVVDDLTPREAEVLELIAQGLDNATIGAGLGISERTARNHVSAVFSKLGVKTRAKAIVLARDAGFGTRRR